MRSASLLILLALAGGAGAQSSWVNGVRHGPQEITVDLPDREQIKNIGSRVDGAGMCVCSSIEMAARWQGLEEMRGWRDWCAANFPGGAYPSKVDQLLAAWWKHRQLAPIPYFQYEGPYPEAFLALCDKTNRCACVTYGYSPRYVSRLNPSGRISHMVCLVGYRQHAVVLDNNFVGAQHLEWMPVQELLRRNKLTGGSAWVFVWRTPGAPPIPRANP